MKAIQSPVAFSMALFRVSGIFCRGSTQYVTDIGDAAVKAAPEVSRGGPSADPCSPAPTARRSAAAIPKQPHRKPEARADKKSPRRHARQVNAIPKLGD